MSAHPNPWGREYSSQELLFAAALWPQYRETKDRTGGPLIYMNGQALLDEVTEAEAEAHVRLIRLRTLKRAVEREVQKTELVDD